jgi:hypothetical protein
METTNSSQPKDGNDGKDDKYCGGKKYENAVAEVDPKLVIAWRAEQREITTKVLEQDDSGFDIKNISHVAGMDISMSQHEAKTACAS